jgi:hypothetical protein
VPSRRIYVAGCLLVLGFFSTVAVLDLAGRHKDTITAVAMAAGTVCLLLTLLSDARGRSRRAALKRREAAYYAARRGGDFPAEAWRQADEGYGRRSHRTSGARPESQAE